MTVARDIELSPALPSGIVKQTTTDAHLVELWLHGRPDHTQRAYRTDVDRFLLFVARPLATTTLGDIHAFADSLSGKPSSRAPRLAAIKSLLAFGQRVGYLPLKLGVA